LDRPRKGTHTIAVRECKFGLHRHGDHGSEILPTLMGYVADEYDMWRGFLFSKSDSLHVVKAASGHSARSVITLHNVAFGPYVSEAER
jgi:hypothetical protein